MYIRIDGFLRVRLSILALNAFFYISHFGSANGIIKHFPSSERRKPDIKESETVHMKYVLPGYSLYIPCVVLFVFCGASVSYLKLSRDNTPR